MPDDTNHTRNTDKDSAIESHRALLRQAIKKKPDDVQLQKTLKELLTPYYVRRAAKQGVFICYARDDELFAFELTEKLRDAGVQAFMDEMDVSDDDDSEWGEEVVSALRQCGAMILVLSPHSLHDAEVQGERLYFLKHGKVVIPALAHQCNIHGLEMAIQPFDFESNYDTAMKALIEMVVKPQQASKT